MNVKQSKHRDLPRTEEKCHYNVKLAGKIEIQFPYTKKQDVGLDRDIGGTDSNAGQESFLRKH